MKCIKWISFSCYHGVIRYLFNLKWLYHCQHSLRMNKRNTTFLFPYPYPQCCWFFILFFPVNYILRFHSFVKYLPEEDKRFDVKLVFFLNLNVLRTVERPEIPTCLLHFWPVELRSIIQSLLSGTIQDIFVTFFHPHFHMIFCKFVKMKLLSTLNFLLPQLLTFLILRKGYRKMELIIWITKSLIICLLVWWSKCREFLPWR